MPNFAGKLNTNEIYASLYNTILRHIVFTDNIYSTKDTLMDMARIDGGLYGDQVLFTDLDIGATQEWLGDAEAPNLLSIQRNNTEVTQAVQLNQFRMTWLTTDNYLSKRAWSDENAFGKFTSALLQTLADSKRVHDASTYNVFIGTNETEVGKQEVEIMLPAEVSGEANVETEARNRIEAQAVATEMSNLIENLKDYTRDYNDYGYLRSYNPDDLVVVWNSEFVNRIRKTDMPTIFKELSIDKFAQHTLTPRFFGKVNTTAGTAPASNISIRFLKETLVSGKNYFAGDLVPANYAYAANTTYTEDPTIAFKVMHKKSVPYMVGFTTSTEFWNPRSLTTNHYTIWGYNDFEHLKGKPFITVRVKPAA